MGALPGLAPRQLRHAASLPAGRRGGRRLGGRGRPGDGRADAFEGGALRDVVQKEASKWLYFSRLVAAAFADHAGVEATRALRTVLWAKAVVATRAVHLSSLGRSLVPFWDLINHGAYAAKREVVDDERVAYVRDAPSDGGELVHDYQLSSSTGGACAWDWLITFGFVPRGAQKVVACARVRVRGEVFELPGDAAALARLDGEDARRALAAPSSRSRRRTRSARHAETRPTSSFSSAAR